MRITSLRIPQPPLNYRRLCISFYFFLAFILFFSLILSLSLSLYVFLYDFLFLFPFLSLCLSLSISIFLSLCFSISISVFLSVSLFPPVIIFSSSPLLFSFLFSSFFSFLSSFLFLSQVGFRVEHPQELINKIQFGDFGELCERGKGKVPLNNYASLSCHVMSCHVLQSLIPIFLRDKVSTLHCIFVCFLFYCIPLPPSLPSFYLLFSLLFYHPFLHHLNSIFYPPFFYPPSFFRRVTSKSLPVGQRLTFISPYF